MRGKNPADTTPFDPKITKTERENRKKKKQATTITPGKSSSSYYLSTDKPLVDYAYQHGPKHYNNIGIPPFSNKFVELKPALLSLIDSHLFVGMDHDDKHSQQVAYLLKDNKKKKTCPVL